MSNKNKNSSVIDIVETINSRGDCDPCIICLDENSTNMIKFPTNRSNCMCKYNIHLECLHKLLKKKCLMCEKKINISKDLKNTILADFEYDNNIDNDNADNESKITHITNIVIGPNARNHDRPFTRIPYTGQIVGPNASTHVDRVEDARRTGKCCCYFLISFLIIIVVGVGIWALYAQFG